MLSRFSARAAIGFGDALARRFAERYPPALDKPDAPPVSANRLARILEGLYAEAQAFQRQHDLGYYRRARLCHAFKWRLLELGYSEPLIDMATEGLVVYLHKPHVEQPEIREAQEKRLRKAERNRHLKAQSGVVSRELSPSSPIYSRAHPSPRYIELMQLYRQMHEHGEVFLDIPPQDTFPGLSLPPQASRIKALIDATGAKRILDYGSGKGKQYQARNIRVPGIDEPVSSIQAYWGVNTIQCYDPAYTPYSTLPQGVYDGVICTDVLEHCPEEDIPWILDEIFSYAQKFVFANVACYPAKKRLPTGENAHCTIRPKQWWADRFQEVAAKYPGVKYEVWIQWKDDLGRLTDEVIRN